MAKTMMFNVRGMTCDNCVHHVTEAIRGVPGVEQARVSLAENSATVEGEFDEKKIIEAVEEEGYELEVRS